MNQESRGLNLQVEEYSPNCPKYINRRQIIHASNEASALNKDAKAVIRTQLTPDDQAFVRTIDTLWIGSYAPNVGADCNHRGGQ